MALTKLQEPDESTLVRYLVGRASEEETEQLDERSTVDEEFALRLRAVEHDLVDAYVSGELTGETLEGFRAQYLRSPAGVAAVEFAEALRGHFRAGLADRTATPVTPVAAKRRPQWRWAAAAVLVAASAWLLLDNLRLRGRVASVRDAQAALEERARRLEADLDRQQAAARAAEEQRARVRDALPAAPEPAGPLAGVLALALPAMTRGTGEPPRIAVPRGVHTVVLSLPLIAVEFERYQATLRAAAGDRVLWRSDGLPAPPAGERPALSVTLRARLLEPGVYTLELAGLSGGGHAEPLDSYPFRVVP